MAKNEVFEEGEYLSLTCSDPATPASGDPVRYGEVPGVAETAERADGTTSVSTEGVYTLSVKGVDQSGNSAVAPGDVLYYVDADTPKLSKKNTGHRFGYAIAKSDGTQPSTLIASAATATIRVKLGY